MWRALGVELAPHVPNFTEFEQIERQRRGFDGQAAEPVMQIECFRRRRDRMDDDQPGDNLAGSP